MGMVGFGMRNNWCAGCGTPTDEPCVCPPTGAAAVTTPVRGREESVGKPAVPVAETFTPAKTDEQKREVVESLLRLWRRIPQRSLLVLLRDVMQSQSLGDYEMLAELQRYVDRNGAKIETPELGRLDVFFFGCWAKDRTGHFTYDRFGATIYRNVPGTPQWIDNLDGVHCGEEALGRRRRSEPMSWEGNENAQPQNRARVLHKDGWTIFAFWDRTADRRFASNGAFVAKGTHDFDVMCEIARKHFPSVWARVTEREPMRAATT